MHILLDGRKTRESLTLDLIERVKSLIFVPTLAIVQVGDRADSNSYIKGKKSFAAKIGVKEKHVRLPESTAQQDLILKVEELNADETIQGIIVQLPLPMSIDADAVIQAIDPKKDVDGLTAHNVKGWMEGREDAIFPATARGVRELLDAYDIDLFGKKVVIIGRSMLVGKPIAAMCLRENATVIVCHSKTPDLAEETKRADIIIVAAGKPGLIKAEHVKEGQIVIDVGINTVKGEKLDDEIDDTKLVGDVDFETVKDIVAAASPVPGGVGPMTVLSIFENLVDLCKM